MLCRNIYGPAPGVSLRIAYALIPLINANIDISSEARGPKFGMSLHLHPYFVYTSGEGSGESAHMRRLT